MIWARNVSSASVVAGLQVSAGVGVADPSIGHRDGDHARHGKSASVVGGDDSFDAEVQAFEH